MSRRETAAYLLLGPVRGVPRLVARVGLDGILVEYIECFRPEDSQGKLTNDFFEELGAILKSLRKRGIIHGGTCRNVRMDSAGNPWLMDFGASFVIRGWFAPIRSNLRRIFKKYDESDVAVLKYRVAPHSLSTSDRETISHQLPFQGLVALGGCCWPEWYSGSSTIGWSTVSHRWLRLTRVNARRGESAAASCSRNEAA